VPFIQVPRSALPSLLGYSGSTLGTRTEIGRRPILKVRSGSSAARLR